VRSGLSASSPVSSDNGIALLGVLAVTLAVVLVGCAVFVLASSEADIVEHNLDDTRAFYIAEGGLERARAWLGVLHQEDLEAVPPETLFTNEPLGGGTYTVRVFGDTTGAVGLSSYEILSTGRFEDAVRQIRALVVTSSFAAYQWYVEDEGGGDSWFHTGEHFEGPIHLNCNLKVDGDPVFEGPVRTVGHYIDEPVSNPKFMMGYEEYVDPVYLPSRETILATVRAEALDGGIYGSSLGESPQFYYDVVLGEPGDGWLTYTGYESDGTPVGVSDTVWIEATNGVAWFEERIRIHGTLDGQLTIGVDNDIEIVDDIVYEGWMPGGGMDPGCDDMLGLIACGEDWGDLLLADTPENMTDLEVHGILMSMEKNIEVENLVGSGTTRGTFTICGSMLSDLGFKLAIYSGDDLTSGYVRDYHYDYRVLTTPPPFFPLTGHYAVVEWEEVVPPELS
jgi:hypothetical protein